MSRRGVDLLTYVDRLAGDLPGLDAVLAERLSDFSGVHLLPCFTPYDGADAGFDPTDHRTVDPRLGTWADVATMAARQEVTIDLIVNHVSTDSAEFADWLEHGDRSDYDGMFLTFEAVFPDGARATDITSIYRPRPGLPFTAYRAADGSRHLVWTTFQPTQADLDITSEPALAYLDEILTILHDAGVTTVRLDAAGYAVKSPGTTSFMTAETDEFLRRITERTHDHGMRVLVEVHSHHLDQARIAEFVDLVYDFVTPPLLLWAFYTGDARRLADWIEQRPTNCVTVLDTHDGIGVIDAGPDDRRDGFLDHDDMARIFREAAIATDGRSDRYSVVPQWMQLPHQINATFLDALGSSHDRMALARAIQLWLPGEPQIYYVGLLGDSDDPDLADRTGVGREVNRRVYTATALDAALSSTFTRAMLALVRFRRDQPSFDGSFSAATTDADHLVLIWSLDDRCVKLDAAFGAGLARPVDYEITVRDGGDIRRITDLLTEYELLAGPS